METITTELCEEPGKRDRRGRRMLGQDEWYRLMAEYDQSGLTQKAFCKREGVNYATFVAWLGRRKKARSTGSSSAAKFHELSLPLPVPRQSGLEIVLNDRTVLRGGGASELAELLRLLRG